MSYNSSSTPEFILRYNKLFNRNVYYFCLQDSTGAFFLIAYDET